MGYFENDQTIPGIYIKAIYGDKNLSVNLRQKKSNTKFQRFLLCLLVADCGQSKGLKPIVKLKTMKTRLGNLKPLKHKFHSIYYFLKNNFRNTDLKLQIESIVKK